MTDTTPLPKAVAIPGVIRKFLERASIGYAATRGADLTPGFHWVSGWALEPDPSLLTVFVPGAFLGTLRANTALGSRLAVTIEQIGSHETYQFKGECAGFRNLEAADQDALEGCHRRFAEAVQEIETRFDFSEDQLRRYIDRPAAAVSLRVHEIFTQTPGPGAGRRLVPPEAP